MLPPATVDAVETAADCSLDGVSHVRVGGDVWSGDNRSLAGFADR